jgi:hypothetical protein
MNQPGNKKLRERWAGPFEVTDVEGDLNVTLQLPSHWRIHPTIHISRLKRAYTRDYNKFPDRSPDDNQDDEVKESAVENTAAADLGGYSEAGAAVAEIERGEREPKSDHLPRTRAAVHRAHDRGEIYDYVHL